MAKHTLLLDFQHDGIDWILMRSAWRNTEVDKFGRLDCRGDIPDDAVTVAALKSLRATFETSELTCLAAIDGRGLLVRHIPLPFRDKRKVRQILPMELEATLPVGIDALAFDFQLTRQGESHAAVAAAMTTTRLTAYLQLMQDAGLDPLLVTLAGLPEAVLLAESPQGEGVSLLVDGDHRHCLLFIIGQHQIVFLRSWRPPAMDGHPADRLQTAVDQTLEAAAHLLPDGFALDAVYVTHRSTPFYPLDRLSTEAFPARIFDIQDLYPDKWPAEAPVQKHHGALALKLYEPMSDKGLNLYRATFPLKRLAQQYRSHLIRSGVLAAALIALLMANVYLDITRAEKRAADMQAAAEAILLQAFPETRNIVNPLQQMIVKIREMGPQDIATNSLRPSQIVVLDAISRALPQTMDIHVNQLVSGTERVQLSGTTDTFEAVNQAKERLEQTALFKDITIVSASMDQNAGRVRFKLAMDLMDRL